MRNVSKLTDLREIARTQHSIVTIEQLETIGWTRSAIRFAVDSGELERLSYRVLRIGGSATSRSQLALAAVLDAPESAALSHGSAASFWEIPGFRFEPVEITMRRDLPRRVESLGTIHRPTFNLSPHVVLLDSVPVLTPIATLWTLATSGIVHPKKIERSTDTLWARRLLTGRTLQDSLEQFGKRGRRGTTLMRELSAARPPEYVAPESGQESRFRDILKKARITGFVRQRNVGSEREWLGRIDFVDEAHKVIVQIDSDRFHSALLDVTADQKQSEALMGAGWQVLRFREWHLWQESHTIIDAIKASRTMAQQRAS